MLFFTAAENGKTHRHGEHHKQNFPDQLFSSFRFVRYSV
jgi:hypothetical protein